MKKSIFIARSLTHSLTLSLSHPHTTSIIDVKVSALICVMDLRAAFSNRQETDTKESSLPAADNGVSIFICERTYSGALNLARLISIANNR
jgi:hypothetical protein